MEQTSLISMEHKKILLDTLKMMFGETKFEDPNSSDSKKVDVLYSIMVKQKWTVEEFTDAIKMFVEKHKDFYWLPASILQYLERARNLC